MAAREKIRMMITLQLVTGRKGVRFKSNEAQELQTELRKAVCVCVCKAVMKGKDRV